MASGFSGYYLALMLVLWGLILRGMAIEVAGHINDRLWQGFWDFVFLFSTLLLALLFGVAGGNLQRGVPLDAQGDFSMAFFTNFQPRGNVGLLDWYTVSVAIFIAVLLAAHGATYLTLKSEGPVHDRSARSANYLWAAVVPLFLAISVETWIVRPGLYQHAAHQPLCWLGLLVIIVAAAMLISGLVSRQEKRAFIGSNALIAAVLGTGAAALYPVMLYSTLAPENSLTADGAASSPHALLLVSIWWPVAAVLAITYFIFISRRYSGRANVRTDNQGFYD